MRTPPIDFDMAVDALMRRWPATIRVLLDHRMLCVGCPVAPFHTIAEACEAHGVEAANFANDLAKTLESAGAPAAATACGDSPRSASSHADP